MLKIPTRNFIHCLAPASPWLSCVIHTSLFHTNKFLVFNSPVSEFSEKKGKKKPFPECLFNSL